MAEKKHVIEYTDIIKAFEKVKEKLKNKSNKGHQHGNADITDIDASKIKSGTIDIDRLPKGAIERMVYVKDDAARFALTTNTTQNGDTVKVTSTKKMFYVIDDTKLSSEAGYEPYTAESASAVPWSGVTGKPTTFTPEAHTHAISEVADLQETLTGLRQDVNAKPSKDTNTTYSLIQDSTDGHKLTFKGSDGSTKTVTIPDNDHNDNTTYSLKKTGSKIQLIGSDGSTTEVTDDNTTYDLDAMINAIPVGTDDPVDNDYYVSQYADGGTSNTGYFRRPVSKLWNYIKTKLATVATSGSYTDLSNKPTIGNGKVTVNQNGTTKGTFTMNQTGDTVINLTDSDTNTNTWRDVVDGLESTRTDASLSANQGRVLNDKFASYLPLHDAADTAASVADYGDTAKHIQIGFSGAGITGDDIKYIAGYTSGDGGNLSAKIKDISKDALKSWLGLGSRAYDSTNYLPLSGGTITGRIVKNTNGSWVGDRDRAVVYSMYPGDDSYGCVACMPTKNGSWSMGNLGGVEHLIFNYVPDANYSANKNESIHVYLRPTEGTIALTKDIPTSLPASDVYAWAKASSKPSYSWGEISGRPTALSSFTNDSGYITGITKAMVTGALGYTPPTTDTNTTYSASTGLNLSGTSFSVKYGSTAGTACQGNDSRLSNSRPASDVYSWAKASSKPSYTWTEISNKPDIPSISKYTPTRTNWTINSEYNCVVYRIGDFCLAVVAVTGTIYPRQWLPAAQLSKDFTPKIQSSIVVCSVSGSDHMECMVTKDGYIKMWWSGSSPATSANICVPYYMG